MAVSFNYIPSNMRVPLFYAEMDNSAANTATGEKKSLLIGLMTAGTAEPNVPVLVSTGAKGKTLFGRGSQLALMAEAYRNNDSAGELWCLPQVLATGESDDNADDAVGIGTAAQGYVTFTGTALAAGTVAFYVGGTKVAATITAGMTASQAAAALAAAINKDGDLPVSAVVNPSDLTQLVLTCKGLGAYGNDIQLAVNRQKAVGGEENVSGLGVVLTAMSGGTGVADVEKAFEKVATETYLFIGIGENDATTLDAVKTEMNDASGRWAYSRMQYGHVFTAKRGDDTTLVTFGSTRNDQHVTIFGIEPQHPDPYWLLAAAATGREAVFITNDPARPTQTGVLIGCSYPAIEDRFNLAERNTLLHNGIATTYTSGGYCRIERAVTTYQVNSFGDADNSYLDSETLFTLAEITTRLKTAITSKYPRHKLASDGTRYGAGQAIVTPSVIRGELIAQYAAMENLGLVENADLFAQYLIVERNADDPNRVDVLFPPDLVNQLRVFALLNQFRLQYSDQA